MTLFIAPYWRATAATDHRAFFAELGQRCFGDPSIWPNGNNFVSKWVDRQYFEHARSQREDAIAV